MRFKEVAASSTRDPTKRQGDRDQKDPEVTPNAVSESLLAGVLDTEEDLLMMYIQSFQHIYKKDYLERVLGYTWREEGMHQMNLRHEAELNELKKLHTQQKQELLDEMKRRKVKVKKLCQRMRDHKKLRREYNDAESMSQLMEFESNSVRSREFPFKGSFLIADDMLTDNLSRINLPLTNHDGEFLHRDDNDPTASQLLIDIHNAKSQISWPHHQMEPKDSSVLKQPSNLESESIKAGIQIDSSKIVLPISTDQGGSNPGPPSPNQQSGHLEGDGTCKMLHGLPSMKENFKVLQLNLANKELEREEDPSRLIKTNRTIDSRKDEGSFHRLTGREDASSQKNLSPVHKRQRFSLEDLREQLEVEMRLR